MKRFAFVPTIEAEGVDGEPLYELTKDGSRRPVTVSAHDFLRGRIADPAFLEGKEGGEGADLQYEARRALRLQVENAAARGYWELEDEQARHILQATKRGRYAPDIGFNVVPHMRAVTAMVDADKWPSSTEEKAA